MMRTLPPNCTAWLPFAHETSSLMVCVGLMRLLVRSKLSGEKTKRNEMAWAAESPCEESLARQAVAKVVDEAAVEPPDVLDREEEGVRPEVFGRRVGEGLRERWVPAAAYPVVLEDGLEVNVLLARRVPTERPPVLVVTRREIGRAHVGTPVTF